MKWKEKLRTLLGAFSVRTAKKYYPVLLVLLLGVFLLAFGGTRSADDGRKKEDLSSDAAFNLQQFETDLGQELGRLDGIGKVSLMLSLEQTEQSVYASDERKTASGEQSESYETTLSVLSDGSYGEEPVTITCKMPHFRGAIVVCEGADDPQVCYNVICAVSTICGVGKNQVTVLKMKAAS